MTNSEKQEIGVKIFKNSLEALEKCDKDIHYSVLFWKNILHVARLDSLTKHH